MITGLESLSYEDRLRDGVVHPEEGSRRTCSTLPVPTGKVERSFSQGHAVT